MKPSLPLLALVTLMLGCSGCGGPSLLQQQAAGKSPNLTTERIKAAMLHRVNTARASGRHCGSQRFGSAAPLTWNDALQAAAQRQSNDMARHDHFSHTGTDGSTLAERVDGAGYLWRTIGENIAFNQRTVAEVMDGWLDSPGHCANIMNPAFTEMGAAITAFYWTQTFAAPR